MHLKVRYHYQEDGEFSNDCEVNFDGVLELFHLATEIVYTKKDFTIKYPNITFFIQSGENFITIFHFAKDVFTVRFCSEEGSRVHEQMFYKKDVLHLLSLFNEQKYDDLSSRIEITKEKKKNLIGEFVTRSFTYTSEKARVPRSIYDTILNAAFPLLFLGSFIYIYFSPLDKGKWGFLACLLVLFVLSFSVFYSVIRLEIDYYKKAKNIKLKISKGEPLIHISIDEKRIEVKKQDISRVTIVDSTTRFYQFYSFTKMELCNGEVFIIPDLIISPTDLIYKIGKVEIKKVHKFYPLIKL